MAIVTKRLGSWEDGQVVWELDWDDATLKLRELRCLNTSPFVAVAECWSIADPTFRHVITVRPETSPFSQNIPAGVANRYDIGIDARGRLSGVDYRYYLQAP